MCLHVAKAKMIRPLVTNKILHEFGDVYGTLVLFRFKTPELDHVGIFDLGLTASPRAPLDACTPSEKEDDHVLVEPKNSSLALSLAKKALADPLEVESHTKR